MADRDDEGSDSPDDLPEGFNPFAGLPIFGDLARALAGQGPINWDIARQMAHFGATRGTAEANTDPEVRFALERLAAIAAMHVDAVSGLPSVGSPSVEPVTPGTWAQRALEAYRPLFTELAASLGTPPSLGGGSPDDDPAMAMMAGLGKMLAPSMMGMSVGSMVGHLGARVFGEYDLPLPRPSSTTVVVVPSAIDAFAAEWELSRDDVRMWVLVQELAGKALYSVPHVRDAVTESVRRHVGAFRPNASAVAERMSGLDVEDAMSVEGLQRMFADPELLLGAVRTPEQQRMQPALDALLALVVGWVDHIVDQAGARLLGSPARIAEAVRRRRVESSPEDVFVERLLGLRLERGQVERGRAFVHGVVERAGPEGLARLFRDASALPTPNELDAPGLWLARLEYDAD